VEAGVDPPTVARSVYDTSTLGRLKLFGAILSRMQLDASGRLAIISVDRRLADDCGGSYEDTEGLINQPLTVKEIQAVVFFKEIRAGEWRVSMRSKGNVDINAVAKEFGGGGHKNASGCSATGELADLMRLFEHKILAQIETVAV
jgi:phosphoesterase RecJ-like protein